MHRRGEGLGSGPVGSSDGYSGRGSGSGTNRAVNRAGGLSLPVILIFLLIKFLGPSLGINLGGSSASSADDASYYEESYSQSGGASGAGSLLDALTGGASGGSLAQGGSSSAGASVSQSATSYSKADTSVASGSRQKYYAPSSGDSVTIMLYMCGTDLESRSSMASNDLGEIARADLGKINVIVYTGGCKKWQTQGISSSVNQIYKIENNGLKCLVSDDGQRAMTDPATLTAFIKYCAKNYPAARNELIFWDHGGGSVSGYGYDEKFPRSGSMSLAGINTALKNGGVKFDFVGFDACLMATAETALMLNEHADYMIASEETEPGIGWYYTNWLTQFGKNTAESTLNLGKAIADDFVATCASQCRGQKTTLSVIDLAEFSNTVPSKLTAFSKSLTNLIKKDEYKAVSNARYQTREFAQGNGIDQIDFVDLCNRIQNAEGTALAKALQGAVKYNKTSSNMTNAYGVSIYFPYQSARSVDEACQTYNAIGMDSSYADCIREFAALETSGQVAAGGTASPVSSLFDLLGGGTPSSSGAIGDLLGSFMQGGGSDIISDLAGSALGFMAGRSVSRSQAADYISLNHFDKNALVWKNAGGQKILSLTESQWDLVHALDLNMFYDDGNGYVDLGLDNVYDWTDSGDLIASSDKTWLSINGQPVAYYHLDTSGDEGNYTITGRVPCMLNGSRVNLILTFTSDAPQGFVAGASTDYKKGETETVAKNLIQLKKGDKVDFLCDFYDYDGNYQDSYYLGEQWTVGERIQISNTNVGSGAVKITYRITDIYNNAYWTPAITN